MKKKKVLAFILAMVMMIASTSVVQAAEIEDSEIAPASTLITASKTVTIGKGKYSLYAYTMSLGYVGEALIEYDIYGYTTTNKTEQEAVNKLDKTLSVTEGLVRRINLATDDITLDDATLTGSYGKFSTQSKNGLYVIYAVGTETFSCSGYNWIAHTYHDNFPISLESNSEEEIK